ncbi:MULTISPECIES: recombination-associated protein RdgC [Vitreoscilla]|uniref:Recombination-associated protein RdgC n=1 Tax=Vitreoscilla stercoraria TaxID=61 RepID=A0ABY4E8V2_VITST|nr:MULTISPECIES: recombination-associated protein RdgC [Vitreoscilla]AUZ04380.1 recombination-associated protein RdgC [Vitreoscilla sp. C1]UOO91892.1 recombination-associated protein RdgC [Vitreoscilla stercoraria]
MWFKQISVFALAQDLKTDFEAWHDKLSAAAFQPCQGLDWKSEGFARAVPFREELIFNFQDTWRFSLRQEDKVLPTTVVREFLDEKLAELQATEGRIIGRKEKMQLKEQITDDLLPRAFVRSRYTEAVMDLQSQLLLVNQSNPNKSENFVSQLRQALGGLPASLPRTQESPSSLMTAWLMQGEAAGNFELDTDCELKGTGDIVPVIKISKQALDTEEVKQHLEHGKICTQLGLIWNEQIRFVLNEDLSLKRIQYLDMLQEEAANQGDDPESLMSATQLIMTQNLSLLVHELIDHLGGLQAA